MWGESGLWHTVVQLDKIKESTQALKHDLLQLWAGR